MLDYIKNLLLNFLFIEKTNLLIDLIGAKSYKLLHLILVKPKELITFN